MACFLPSTEKSPSPRGIFFKPPEKKAQKKASGNDTAGKQKQEQMKQNAFE
jgi:hypothetical protein